ncbi:MAG: hypothetical protein DDT19_01918 [Syntrophomonadaceae bacterium]|nr:hypothetical protein [Bacillota bacterium]
MVKEYWTMKQGVIYRRSSLIQGLGVKCGIIWVSGGATMKETFKQREAFDYYYALGAKRSLSALSSHLGYTLRTVENWSVKFSWQNRVEQRDIEIGRRLQQEMDETITAIKANYRRIIKEAVKRWVERFKVEEINLSNVQDLERLIKLDLLLMGEATELKEHAIDIDYQDALLSRLNSLAARCREGGESSGH